MVNSREKVDVGVENISTATGKLEGINAFIPEKNTEECLS